MSIQITITADTAADTVQLVQDLASVLASMDPADIPMKTEVDATEKDKPKRQTKPRADNKQAKDMEPETEKKDSVVEEITDVELRKQATAVTKAGKKEEVKALVDSFGVPNLTAIPQNKRAEFLKKLEAL